MHDSIFEHKTNIFSIKEIYLMEGFKSSLPLEFFIIIITRNYFPLVASRRNLETSVLVRGLGGQSFLRSANIRLQ